jgi:hypothetical protein
MELTPLTTSCANGACPDVFRSKDGGVVVRGIAVPPTDAGIEVGPGEALVEIPADVLLEAARHLVGGAD